jgi:hypothetical protein
MVVNISEGLIASIFGVDVEAISSSKTLITTCKTTQHHNLEGKNPSIHILRTGYQVIHITSCSKQLKRISKKGNKLLN